MTAILPVFVVILLGIYLLATSIKSQIEQKIKNKIIDVSIYFPLGISLWITNNIKIRRC